MGSLKQIKYKTRDTHRAQGKGGEWIYISVLHVFFKFIKVANNQCTPCNQTKRQRESPGGTAQIALPLVYYNSALSRLNEQSLDALVCCWSATPTVTACNMFMQDEFLQSRVSAFLGSVCAPAMLFVWKKARKSSNLKTVWPYKTPFFLYINIYIYISNQLQSKSFTSSLCNLFQGLGPTLNLTIPCKSTTGLSWPSFFFFFWIINYNLLIVLS